MTGYFWRFGKRYLIFIFIGAIAQAAQLYTEVELISTIINALINGTFDLAVRDTIIYCSVLLVCKLYTDFSYYYYPLLAARVSERMAMELMRKSIIIDYFCFDDSKYYDAYTRASSEADMRLQNLIGTYIGLVHSTLSVATMITLLSQTHILYLLIVIVNVVCSLIVSTKRNRIKYKFEYESTQKFRFLAYVKNLFFNPSVAKEIRVYESAPFFLKKYSEEYKRYYASLKKYNLKYETPAFIESIVGHICLFGNMMVAIWQVTTNDILPGTFMATILASSRLKDQLLSFLGLIPNFSQHALYIENMRVIFDYEPIIEKTSSGLSIDKAEGIRIEFDHVSFKYPNSENYVLKNVCLTMDSKKKCALVGENGAGKTTIVKLILRLYDPTEGVIRINGRNIQEYNIQELRSLYSVVFQDYNQYHLTLGENISFSDMPELSVVDSVLNDLDLTEKISNLPNGLNSQLGKYFDKNGVMLSGGEAQRLALARAFYHSRDVLILDEPSSALDPIAEDRLIQSIEKQAEGKSMLVISHRLSLCKDMDTVYYLQKGEIAESGSHSDLMNKKGLYYEMFSTQAKHYQ